MIKTPTGDFESSDDLEIRLINFAPFSKTKLVLVSSRHFSLTINLEDVDVYEKGAIGVGNVLIKLPFTNDICAERFSNWLIKEVENGRV